MFAQALENLCTDLRAVEDPAAAVKMSAYMRDQFPFLGIKSPQRKALQKPLLELAKSAPIEDVLGAVEYLWEFDEREFQHTGCELLRAGANGLRPEHLPRLRQLITNKSWWDTVDALATRPLGTVVLAHSELGATMDEWIHDDDFWIARSAIIHQLFFKDEVNEERLFNYVKIRAADTEFFIRKALGWALRSYGRVEPDAVRDFVAEHHDALSGLTRREALKHL